MLAGLNRKSSLSARYDELEIIRVKAIALSGEKEWHSASRQARAPDRARFMRVLNPPSWVAAAAACYAPAAPGCVEPLQLMNIPRRIWRKLGGDAPIQLARAQRRAGSSCSCARKRPRVVIREAKSHECAVTDVVVRAPDRSSSLSSTGSGVEVEVAGGAPPRREGVERERVRVLRLACGS